MRFKNDGTPQLNNKESVDLMKTTLIELVDAFSKRERKGCKELQFNIDYGGEKFTLLLSAVEKKGGRK